MSTAAPFNPFKTSSAKDPMSVESPSVEDAASAPAPPAPPAAPLPPPTVLISAEDAYIHERMRAQPHALQDIGSRVAVAPRDGLHRLSLPDALEAFSYDCTQGVSCKAHAWTQTLVEFADGATLPRWDYDRAGKGYVFRWVAKVKRVLDAHMNLHGWMFVNARYFPDAPAHLFTANGGVEVGGDILMFLPVKQALAIRRAPGERSRELLRGRITPAGKPGRVLMGSPDNPLHYMPDVHAEEAEGTVPTAGALVEGRDF